MAGPWAWTLGPGPWALVNPILVALDWIGLDWPPDSNGDTVYGTQSNPMAVALDWIGFDENSVIAVEHELVDALPCKQQLDRS